MHAAVAAAKIRQAPSGTGLCACNITTTIIINTASEDMDDIASEKDTASDMDDIALDYAAAKDIASDMDDIASEDYAAEKDTAEKDTGSDMDDIASDCAANSGIQETLVVLGYYAIIHKQEGVKTHDFQYRLDSDCDSTLPDRERACLGSNLRGMQTHIHM